MSKDEVQFVQALNAELADRLRKLERGDADAIITPMENGAYWIAAATVVAIVIIFAVSMM